MLCYVFKSIGSVQNIVLFGAKSISLKIKVSFERDFKTVYL